MARGGINKAVVQKARQALLARGENPSIDAIRIELGNTGSKTTIHRYLKELENETGQQGRTLPLSDQLANLVSQLAERLTQEAQESVAQEREQLAKVRVDFQTQLRQAETRIQQLTEENAGLVAQLKEGSQALQQVQQQWQDAEVDKARLQQQCHDLQARLVDRDEQVRSLEDKHQHARDALEHYRQASKEQREQEQRRHESQVQQMQVETRQLQQTLIVKQDELTRLHRDNERLITEARLLQKAQRVQVEQIEQQTRELGELRSALQQSEKSNAALLVRGDMMQAEVARLTRVGEEGDAQVRRLQEQLGEATVELLLLRRNEEKEEVPAGNSDAVAE